jgi:hypothetical protein
MNFTSIQTLATARSFHADDELPGGKTPPVSAPVISIFGLVMVLSLIAWVKEGAKKSDLSAYLIIGALIGFALSPIGWLFD